MFRFEFFLDLPKAEPLPIHSRTARRKTMPAAAQDLKADPNQVLGVLPTEPAEPLGCGRNAGASPKRPDLRAPILKSPGLGTRSTGQTFASQASA